MFGRAAGAALVPHAGVIMPMLVVRVILLRLQNGI
jgi:hypothetical protein